MDKKRPKRQPRGHDVVAVGVDLRGPVTHHGVDQVVAGREVPVERAWPDSGALRDVVERRPRTLLPECAAGGRPELVVVALRVCAERLAGLRWSTDVGTRDGRHSATSLVNRRVSPYSPGK